MVLHRNVRHSFSNQYFETEDKLAKNVSAKNVSSVTRLARLFTGTFLVITILVASGILVQRLGICYSK